MPENGASRKVSRIAPGLSFHSHPHRTLQFIICNAKSITFGTEIHHCKIHHFNAHSYLLKQQLFFFRPKNLLKKQLFFFRPKHLLKKQLFFFRPKNLLKKQLDHSVRRGVISMKIADPIYYSTGTVLNQPKVKAADWLEKCPECDWLKGGLHIPP